MAGYAVSCRGLQGLQKNSFLTHNWLCTGHSSGSQRADLYRAVSCHERTKKAVTPRKSGYFAVGMKPDKRRLTAACFGRIGGHPVAGNDRYSILSQSLGRPQIFQHCKCKPREEQHEEKKAYSLSHFWHLGLTGGRYSTHTRIEQTILTIDHGAAPAVS